MFGKVRVWLTVAVQDLLASSDVFGCSDGDCDSFADRASVLRQFWIKGLNGGTGAEHQAGVGTAGVIENAESGEYCCSNAYFLAGQHWRVCRSCQIQGQKG